MRLLVVRLLLVILALDSVMSRGNQMDRTTKGGLTMKTIQKNRGDIEMKSNFHATDSSENNTTNKASTLLHPSIGR